GGSVPASISIGAAMRNRGDSVSPEQLVALADAALYHSKREGRDRVTVAGTKREASSVSVGTPAHAGARGIRVRGRTRPGGRIRSSGFALARKTPTAGPPGRPDH